MKTITIGLLFPRSALYRSIGFDVTDAFRLGITHFNNTSINIKIVTESAGVGADYKEIYKCAEKLLIHEGADILVAYIDHYAAVNLEPLCNAAGKLLIVMEPGATIPDNWTASPFRFHMTLQAAVAGRITARTALGAGMSRMAFCTTYYDGGYHNCSSLVSEFLEGGGEIKYNCVVPFRYEEFDINPLVAAIEEFDVNGVLAQLSIESGAVFLDAYSQTGLPQRIPYFYASPFSFEEQFLDQLKFPFTGIVGFTPWSRQLLNDENTQFLTAMEEECNKQGNCFSVLAWDTAQFVCLVAEALIENKMNAMKASGFLKGTEIKGPRGTMKLDDRTNYFTAPLYEAEILPDNNGMSRLELGDRIAIDDAWTTHIERPLIGANSRWLNTYLCTT